MCRITWGVIWIFQNGGRKFCMKSNPNNPVVIFHSLSIAERWIIRVFSFSQFFFLVNKIWIFENKKFVKILNFKKKKKINFIIFKFYEFFEIFRNFLKSYEILEILWKFGKFGKKMFSEIHVFRSDQFSFINVSLFTSVVCVLSKWITKKTWKMLIICNKWWNSFMNQSLNHLVLYEKCNCIRIMSLNHKHVDIIWHYWIISQITLHGFWKRSDLTNMKKDAL